MSIKSLDRAAVLCVVAGTAVSSLAQDADWVDAVDGSWSDAARWSGGVSPNGATFDVAIDAMGAAYTVNLDVNAIVDTLLLDSADATLVASGRTLTVGSLANFASGRASFFNSTITGAGMLTNSAVFDTTGTVTISTATFDNDGDFNITATGSASAQVNRTGGMTNTGTVTLTSTAATNATLNTGGTFRNEAGGVLNVESGAGGLRSLTTAALENEGAVHLNRSTNLNASSGVYTNNGTWNVNAGTATLSGSGVQTFNQNGGVLNLVGDLQVNAEVFNFNGGEVTGNNVSLFSSTLNINAGGSAGFTTTGTTTFGGNVFADQEVVLLANGSASNQFNAGAFSNSGDITLTSTAATNVTLAAVSLTNNADGSLTIENGSGGLRSLATVELVNDGVVEISRSTNLNGASGIYTNNGTWNTLAGTTTLSGSGLQTFNQDAGTLNNQGRFFVNAERFNFNGGEILGNSIEAFSSTVNNNADGSVTYDLTGNTAWTGDVAASQDVNLIANGSSSKTFNVGTFSNSGDIVLTSTAATNVTFVANSFTNNAEGSLTVENGNGGLRDISTGTFVNDGTVETNRSTDLDGASGTYTNNGAWTNVSGTTSLNGSGSLTFNQNAGTLDNQGRFFVSAEIFNYNGGTITGNNLELFSSTLNNLASGSVSYDLTGNTTYAGEVASGQTLNLIATGSTSKVLSAGTFSSSGEITMTSTAATNVTFIADAFTNNAGGVFNVEAGAGGLRDLSTLSLVNNGAVQINANVDLDGSSGVYTNTGTFTIAAGRTATLSGSGTQTFNQNAGTLANMGAFQINAEIFNFNGGEVLGNDLSLFSGTINNNAAGTVHYDVVGNVTYNGDISGNQSLDVIANGSTSTTVNASSFANSGIVTLTSVAATNATLLSGGTITNNADGVVNVEAGSGGLRSLTTAGFVNNGEVNINASVRLDGASGVYTNNNNWSIASGRTLTLNASGTQTFNQQAGVLDNQGAFVVSGEVFNHNGGVITGNNVVVFNGTLGLGAGGAAEFDTQGSVTLVGNVGQPHTVNVVGTGATSSTLTGGSFSSDGLIRLTSVAATNATLNGSDFTNNAGGEVRVENGAGGVRSIGIGMIVNDGLFQFNRNTNVSSSGMTFANNGTVRVSEGVEAVFGGSGVVTFRNGVDGVVTGSGRIDNLSVDVFENDGTFAPGDDIGTLTYEGNWSQRSPGSLDIDIMNTGSFDRFLVTGSATLDGALRVFVSGNVAANDSFVILDAASLTGTFANAASTVSVVGGGQFDVIYDETAGTVTLTNFIPTPGTLGVLAAAGLFIRRRR